MEIPEIMTANEVAKLLRVTPQHVRKLARANTLPHMRIGTEYRFVRDELVARYPSLGVLIKKSIPERR